MRKIFLSLLLVGYLAACTNKEEQNQNANTKPADNANTHEAVVEEVIYVSDYTYLRVKENEKEYWLAVTKTEINKGEVLIYKRSMEMKNFHSKELDRTFETILFIDQVDKKLGSGTLTTPQKPVIEKLNVKVEPANNGITIAQLFNNMNSYSNKNATIKGIVTKINSGIMKRNWIHIQDGTSSGENFDLTVTTNEKVSMGEEVIFNGKISINKDFGYGYSYKVLMEDAKTLKNL